MDHWREDAPFLSRRFFARLASAAAALIAALTPSFTENAIANGETRTLYLFHSHTKEQIAATYLVNGRYDQSVLEQLNWFLRDWRRDEPTKMDPHLFDVVWEAYRQAGATDPVHVVSAYRSPETNAMLRRRSRAVAKYSQHMLGKAMDTTMPGMSMEQIREIGMRMQRGGVGYYPTAGTPFVHLDVGGVRSWPRMSYDQLSRLFPDGKTVHLPTNNQPLARYEEAKAEIEARGNGAYVPAVERQSKGLFAMLFGGGEEDEDSAVAAAPPAPRKQWASLAPRRSGRVSAGDEEESAEAAPAGAPSRREQARIASAERDLPRGETQLRPAPEQAVVTRSVERGKPVALASLEMSAEEAKIEAKLDSALAAPLPPRRPMFVSLAEAPLPPARPSELTTVASLQTATPASLPTAAPAAALPARRAGGAIASLVDLGAAGLRGGVSEESARAAPSPPARSASPAAAKPEPLLAYAPSAARSLPYEKAIDEKLLAELGVSPELRVLAAKPAPVARPAAAKVELVPARLDRSNFQALTTAVSASRLPGGTTLGTTFAAPRSAARADAGLFSSSTASGQAQAFAGQTAILPTDRFVSAR